MRRFLPIWLFLILAGAAFGEEPTLKLSRDSVYEGESVLLTVMVPDGGEDTTVDLSGVPDIRIKGARNEQQNQFSFYMGPDGIKRSGFRGMILEYELVPLNTGPCKGTITVTASGQTRTLPFPPLTVLEIPKQDSVLLDIQAEPASVLPDEIVTVTVRMRVRRLAPPWQDTPPFMPGSPPLVSIPYFRPESLPGVEFPDLNTLLQSWLAPRDAPGFQINDYTIERNLFDMRGLFDDLGSTRPAIFLPEGRPVEQDGRSYFEYTLAVPFKAREEGSFTFGPVSLRGAILVGVDRQRRGQAREIFAVARAATVRVAPPPEEGRPAFDFGLAGTNLTADAQLNTSACKVGDPLKLTLRVRGNLNWERARPPDVNAITNLLSGFKVYATTLQTSRLEDGREYTFTLRPLEAGTVEIPPIPISWYDTATRAYRTVMTSPLPLRVDPSAELAAGNWDRVAVEDPVMAQPGHETIPSALRFNEMALPRTPSPLPVLALLAAGPAWLAIVLILNRLRRTREGRLREGRRRKALDRALDRLSRITAGATPRETANRVCGAMAHFAADILDREPAGLTPPDWNRLLREHGIPGPLAEEFEQRMQDFFEAAYNPAQRLPDTGDKLAPLPDLLRRIHQAARHPRPSSPASRAVLLALALAFPLTAQAREAAPERQFEWEEARALAARASTPLAFREAAARYSHLADAGVRSGELFYNMGTCLLLAGEPEGAWRAFVRAERYWGRPPDLARNMELARKAMKDGEAVPTWDRTLLFLHFGLPLRVRMILGTFGFLVACLALSRLMGDRNRSGARLVAILGLTVAVAFGSSVGVTLFQEATAEPVYFSGSIKSASNPAAASVSRAAFSSSPGTHIS